MLGPGSWFGNFGLVSESWSPGSLCLRLSLGIYVFRSVCGSQGALRQGLRGVGFSPRGLIVWRSVLYVRDSCVSVHSVSWQPTAQGEAGERDWALLALRQPEGRVFFMFH